MSFYPLPYLERKAVFMGSSESLEGCEKVIIGIPMDLTTSFRPGTRLAPFRIREVSEGIEEYSIYQDKSLEDIKFYDAGDIIIPYGNVEESLRRIEEVTGELLKKGKKVFALGGEHLVSLPLIKAYKKFYPDLVVIQFDAHADLRSSYLGESLSHATVMRRVVEIIGTGNLYQLGIRSGTREEMEYATLNTNLYLNQLSSVVAEVKKSVGRRKVYITLDIDVLDPAFAPGTGTPEAGGFSSRELLEVLLELKDLDIAGFDLVEISPPYEQNDNTSLLGAKILREVLLAY
ncbi:agmatinase [Thermosyntropha lipolytica DSM 11003]|uniref:Agmatinase n=1 Tax=Thermosyntropha lipolytica DSM 11003 TaxID=1123382 RepID=A0A1M5NCI0_9FIRM|nr:agmatinase [Thermosyntropha lipolytica]SHG87218.1 agmatinase [Thermosyntropha lipolytica DSM 11003]